MVVELFKKFGTYVDKTTGEQKRYTNFYVKCNDQLIPIEPCYFPQDKYDKKDPFFQGRKAVLDAFATELPALPPKDANQTQAAAPETVAADMPVPPVKEGALA